MVLDAKSEGIIAEPDLLDDVVLGTPRFDFKAFAQRIHRLMMRAVHLHLALADDATETSTGLDADGMP
jgi:hypothetical protein